jgi:hypothetical protein
MNRILSATLLCLVTGAAGAGDSGAGPAASSGPGIGSIVTPGSHALLGTAVKDENSDRVAPGNGATIVLQGDALARTAAALRAFAGATVTGDTIAAPTVLADGTPASIALNTRNGRLTVTRHER